MWLCWRMRMKPYRKVLNLKRLFSRHVQSHKSSYFHQPGDVPLSNLTVGKLVDRAADAAGDRTAFISCHQGISATFSEFKLQVDRFASGLLALGLTRGDRIALCAPNMFEWPVMQFATAKAGLVLVNINPAYQADELQYCLKKVGCRAFIAAESFKGRNYYETICLIVPELPISKPGALNSSSIPLLQSVIFLDERARDGTLSYNDVLDVGDSKSDKILGRYEEEIQFDDPVNIQFTSGTTGNPKGATLTHHNIVNNCLFTGRRMGYHEQKPILCCQVPMYHCFGCVIGTLSSVFYQYTCVYPSPRFSAAESIKAVQNEKCTMIYGTPTMFVDILNTHKSEMNDLSSLRQVLVSGAACPQNVLKEMKDKWKLSSIHIAYGCTENSPVVVMNPVNEDPDVVYKRLIPPLEHIEFKIVNKEGYIVPLGCDGELLTRGYALFAGYWDEPNRTAEVMDVTGWFRTGDLLRMHADGYLEVIGREKDMIIRGGENIYPQEIENFLHKHPAVQEVHICGVPDHRMGEEICSWIKIKDGGKLTVDDVKDYCKGKISHFKVPRYILFVDDFPKTVTGKVQKFKLRQKSKEMLGI